MRFSYDEVDKYSGNNSGASYFSLKDDRDTARVHLLGDDMNDFPGYAVHRVPVGDSYKYVNCLREPGSPVTDCPFCAEGRHDVEVSKVHAKLFIPLYNCDLDKVQVWERGKKFFRDLASYCSHNPEASKVVTEIERRGSKGDTSTTYGLYALNERDNFSIENVRDEIPEILGDVVLDKSYEDMQYYVKNKSFPGASDSGVTRRDTSRRDDDRQDRRTPSRRRDAEDEY